MPDGWTLVQSAPESSSADGWTMVQERRPISAEDFIDQHKPEGSAVERFLGGVGDMLNPISMVKGAIHTVAHPVDTATGLLKAQTAQFSKAKQDYEAGRGWESAAHAAAGVLPVVGPMAAAIGEEAAGGDIAGAVGKLVGLAAPVAAVKAAPAVLRLPGIGRNPNPAAAAATDLAIGAGVPVDAATATGNRFVGAAQHLSDRTLGGSIVAGRKLQQQSEGLATLGEQLAAKGHPAPMSVEQAGEGVRSAVMDQIRTHSQTADAGYSVLRRLEADPANARPIKMADGSVAMMPMPVDIRAARSALRPLYTELSRQAQLTPAAMMGDKARALQALDKLMAGPSHAPLSVVDGVLSDIKSFARTDVPELRTAGQGAAAMAVKHLDTVVRKTAADAGPLAEAALRTGREATIAKYGAADVLDSLATEPVRTIQKLTAPKDTAVEQLRAVAKQAPSEIPKIGRAYLDDLLTQAKSEGGFGHAKALAAKWEKLGPQTKLLLYKDPSYITDLDRFFQLAKMAAETPNPSGTAHTLLTASQGGLMISNPIAGTATQLGGAALSSLLHSRRGVQLLTRGFALPVKKSAESAAWLAGLRAATSPSESQMRTAPAR